MRTSAHDLFFKIAFSDVADVSLWLQGVLPPELVAAICWGDLRLVSGDQPDEGGGASRGDLTFATTLQGYPVVILIPLEHQRRNDRHMDLRALGYSLQGLRGWQRAHAKTFELPVVLAVVVFQGPGHWTAARDVRDRVPLPAHIAPVFAPYLIGQRYILLDLREQPELCEVGPASLRIATRLLAHVGRRGRAALLRAHRSDLLAAIRARGSSFRDAIQRYTLAVEEGEEAKPLFDALNEEEPMRKSALDVFEEAVAARSVVERAEGKLEGKVEIILRLGQSRFGAPSAAVRDRLQEVSIQQVDSMIDRIFLANSWEALLNEA